MYYILSENIALRSWWLVPYAYYKRNARTALGLKKDEFELLSICDGQHDIPESELIESLLQKRLICPVKRGEKILSEWQKPMVCDNRYMPSMNWMITGKCNYNCLHCFNAKDNAPLQSEWSLEEANKLLDEARDCGINGFTITGGEPMAHKNFFEIIEGIYRRGMYVFELNTNGFYIDQAALDRMKEIGCDPMIKISFDGFGFHDWMRNRKGAEEDTLRAVKLCIKNGFRVMIQTNINRKNKDSILGTIEYMDKLGVYETRVICTTESTRWEANAAGQTLSVAEYFDTCIDISKSYIKNSHKMIIDFWQLMTVYPISREYILTAARGCVESYRESRPVCQGNRGMIAVSANGGVFPCLQMSGWFEAHGINFGNLKNESLRFTLQSSKYIDTVFATVGDKIRSPGNNKCGKCQYLELCRGGCPAIGALFANGDLMAPDLWKCFFYDEGYYEKCIKELAPYRNVTDISNYIRGGQI